MQQRWLDWTVASNLPLAPPAAFTVVLAEVGDALHRAGIDLVPGPAGTLTEKGRTVGRVRVWDPGRSVVLEWHPAHWHPEETTEVAIRFQRSAKGTRVTLEHRGFGSTVGEESEELAGWFASALLAPVLAATAPERLGDWVTDRRARRPSGASAATAYADPLYHRPNFLLLIDTLRPRRSDRILEVGCGGGALLKDLLRFGCRATGVDHSAEMLRVAAAENADAIAQGRLRLVEGDAAHLPVRDREFTAAVSTGAFGFLPDPLGTLREMRRALVPGGRFALFQGTRELAGTPACPEPIASRVKFYEDAEIESLVRQAGFVDVRVTLPDLGPYARAAQLPPEVIEAFAGLPGGAQLVVARRSRRGAPSGRGRARTASRTPGTLSARTRPRRRANPGARARRG